MAISLAHLMLYVMVSSQCEVHMKRLLNWFRSKPKHSYMMCRKHGIDSTWECALEKLIAKAEGRDE